MSCSVLVLVEIAREKRMSKSGVDRTKWSKKTMITTLNPATEETITKDLITDSVRTYLTVHAAYRECHEDIRAVIDEMAEIVKSEDSQEDEKAHALMTICGAMFPGKFVDLHDRSTIGQRPLAKLDDVSL